MKNKHWVWLLAGYLIGSYFGVSHLRGLVGGKG